MGLITWAIHDKVVDILSFSSRRAHEASPKVFGPGGGDLPTHPMHEGERVSAAKQLEPSARVVSVVIEVGLMHQQPELSKFAFPGTVVHRVDRPALDSSVAGRAGLFRHNLHTGRVGPGVHSIVCQLLPFFAEVWGGLVRVTEVLVQPMFREVGLCCQDPALDPVTSVAESGPKTIDSNDP